MRDFLNAILAFVGSASLTDDEYNSIDQTGLVVSTYNLECYNALSAIIQARGSIGTTGDRLRYLFLSKGVAGLISTGKSNIYIGDVL